MYSPQLHIMSGLHCLKCYVLCDTFVAQTVCVCAVVAVGCNSLTYKKSAKLKNNDGSQ